MIPMITHMREHYWKNFCEAIGATQLQTEIFEKIMVRYCEPWRHYHTFTHIYDCLHNLDDVRGHTIFPILTEGAVWFHDVVYNSKMKDNEFVSAEYAEACLVNMGVKDEYLIKNIPLFIKASTHTYKPAPLTEINLFLDIDLASLGYSLKTFQDNTRDIRKEYSWVPDDTFIQERTNILANFLKRPSIYYTDFFKKKYEAQARANLSEPILI